MNLDAPFTIDSSAHGDGVRLALAGRVDRDAEDDLLAAFDAAATSGASRIVLDFHDAAYINSSGLAAIVALLADARERGVGVAARGLDDHYRHLFEITRLSDLIEVEPAPERGGAA